MNENSKGLKDLMELQPNNSILIILVNISVHECISYLLRYYSLKSEALSHLKLRSDPPNSKLNSPIGCTVDLGLLC